MAPSGSSRRAQSQWPPAPCVEEEPQSLSKELNGLSKLGDKPGVDGVHTRGAVNQYPIIVYASSPPPLSTSPASVPSVPELGSASSDESSGPMTPPPQEPTFRNTVRFATDETPKRTLPSIASQPRGPPSRPLAQQQPTRDLNTQREPQPPSHHWNGNSSRHMPPTQKKSGSRGPIAPDRSGDQAPMHDKDYVQPVKTSIDRSNSVRQVPSTTRQMKECFRREPSSGYLSDSTMATTCNRSPSNQPQVPVSTAPRSALPNGPTIAERIEEKLRQRQEQRDLGTLSAPKAQRMPTTAKPVKPSPLNTSLPPPPPPPDPASASVSHPPSRAPQPVPAQRTQQEVPPASRARATSVTVPPTRSMSASRYSSRPSSEVTKSTSTQIATQLNPDGSLAHPAPPRPSGTSPQRPDSVGLGLSPCPRTIAVAGYQDWYTLKGLTHLDICPSCMSQIAHSRYCDYFIPSLSKPAGQKTRCAFANAWTRLAWTQMIKKQHDSLELLYQMTRPPPGTRPCSGRIVAEQYWHRIYDPKTGSDLSGFHVCSSCARNIRILMPCHRETFQPSSEPTERVCDFVTSSPRFVKFIDLLDASASCAESDSSCTRRPDTREFLTYARRKVMLRDCRRDRPALGTWHFIPSLPEMCVCEDCYDEVVWPLARSNHPIACMVTTKLRILPGDGPGRTREASCQLYSPRMRAKFREAVVRDDLELLRSVAQRRAEAERRFLDRREELLIAQSKGYNCDEEMRKAVGEWRRWE
ncbi:protein related to ser/arg-related nuclear matrix protein [Penicillium digitatum]|uniref:Uncharacterized protein n=3 Tax=Penicillium digitatum TaxID=36651 RepID=K9G0J2_PEND2|nr:hypothetical protein PDIP_60440 [Penicillium digitatum Pd1]EKV10328.1 hypothetical protein PDIP_60440 [Penicillium digitatum Pd1]EKV15475.1 hypothetical protein PDIG_25960 [Penicillium digitatum PHI26]KAG0157442.1 hypothetical protein PDIDSM_4627 [Penicillium digitatum]QQK44232.1 protein related to ser/arg-related nuclear matrix protein [Penicillium digitatum]